MVVAYWMVQKLTRELNDLQKKMMEKTTQLSNHQKYASRLGGSSILNLGNIAGLSSQILPRAMMFAQYSDQASSMSAMQNLQMMKMTGRIPYFNNPMMQMQLEMSAFRQFKEEALKALKQQEIAQMNEIEKEIQLEVNSIEMDIKKKEKQLDVYKDLASRKIEDTVPKFGLS